MKRKFKKFIVMLLVIMTIATSFTLTAHAVSLDYSGGSSSNSTGAGGAASGYQIRWDSPVKNLCGYRFSIVTSAGAPKSGTKVANVYLTDSSDGNKAYSSGQRFIVSNGIVANKKQLTNGTKVYSSKSTQSCDFKSNACGFYSSVPLNPSDVGNWIKSTASGYLNLQRIYVICGTNLANASESDYVLIEPIYWAKLAGTNTSSTPTELAIYGAAISGGDQYNGCNGNLTNAGRDTLWNLCNYVNREFPNGLYVSSDTDVYSAVSIKTSGRYTYKQIIQNGYGCSVLTVRNVIPIKKVYLAYNPNGGTTTTSLHQDGWIMIDGAVNFHSITHGQQSDPYNATTFGMTKQGYNFIGWKVYSTGQILDQDTAYDSTVYAQYNDSSKTTANTNTVYCHLYAVWEKNTYVNTLNHWAWGFNGNGHNGDKQAFRLTRTTYKKTIGDVFTLTKNEATAIPNGFYLHQAYGTSYITGNWTHYPFGTGITQKASAMSAEYDYSPITYNIAYDLNGGTNNANNPTTYNVLYGKDLYSPTKSGYEFLGWMRDYTSSQITLPAADNNYHFYSVLNDIEPGTEYEFSIGNAKVTNGTAANFTCMIYDFTDNKVLTSTNLSFGKNLNYSLTCPTYANASHDIQIIIYSGVNGSTSGVGTAYTSVNIKYYVDGINKGCDSVFSSSEQLYAELAKRTTGDIKLVAKWNTNANIAIVPIDPNAQYREKTNVMSSFWLVNISNYDYTPSTGAKVVFGVYNSDGQKIAGETQSFVSPNNDKNLAYFKWYVPDGYASSYLTVKAYILDGTNQYGHIERSYEIVSYDICKTPDTSYKNQAPEDFSVPSSGFDNNAKARWWQWEYIDGEFIKKQYAVSNSAGSMLLTTPTNPSAYFESGKLVMKSGYGFECSFIPEMFSVSGYESNSASKCVAPQYFYALFPEYNYSYGIDKSRSFEIVSGKKVFVNTEGMGRQHFTPVYYPDGKYNFQVVLSDCWTPAGMLTSYKTMTIQIDGNMYDDWYVGRK